MGCVCQSESKDKTPNNKETQTNLNTKESNKSSNNNTKGDTFIDPNIEKYLSLKSDNTTKPLKSLSKLNNESTMSLLKINNPPKQTKFVKGHSIYKGEYGEIYSGLSLETGEIIAIKTIDLNYLNETQKNEKYKSLEKISSMKHKNLINIMKIQEAQNSDKFCNGGSIKQLLKKFGFFEEKLIKIYIKQILEGLSFLHENDIVHKNLVSSNILVDGNGIIKINDYSINGIINDENTENLLKGQTKNYKILPYWISPEIAELKQNIDYSTDIWNIGSLIIEMATKKFPWENMSDFKSSKELIFYIASSKNPPKLPNHLTMTCKNFLLSCFQRNPKYRPTAKKLLEHEFFKVRNPQNHSNDISNLKFGNSQICKENFKSTYLLKNHIILNEDEISSSNEKGDERKLNKLERNSRISSIKEDKEKIINFLSDNPENGAFFSFSMSVYSQKSFEDKKSNFVKENIKKLNENIVEEMNEALEHSPNIKDYAKNSTNESEKQRHFDFTKV